MCNETLERDIKQHLIDKQIYIPDHYDDAVCFFFFIIQRTYFIVMRSLDALVLLLLFIKFIVRMNYGID